MKVLCIGTTYYNMTCPVNEYPIENGIYDMSEKIESVGGKVPITAFLLSSWGIETYLATVIGNDEHGQRAKKEFAQAGIKPEYIETNFEKGTPMSLLIVNKANGSSTTINLSADIAHIKKEEWSIEPDVIYFDVSEYHAALIATNKFPKATTIFNASKPTLETYDLCKYAKYIICSKEFAEATTKIAIDYNNPNSLTAVFNMLADKFVNKTVIVTLNEHGTLYSFNENIKIMQGIKSEIKDISAAGDVFRGAFIYGFNSKYDFEKNLQIANIASGLSVGRLGTKTSIPTLNEVLNYYTQKFGTKSVTSPVNPPPVSSSVTNPNPNAVDNGQAPNK